MTVAANPISVDWHTGTATHAGPLEAAGLRIMRLAASLLAPLDSFGFSYVASLVGKIFPSDRSVRLQIDTDSSFTFPYGDRYWSRMLQPGSRYEEEIEDLLIALKSVDYAFVDCGANYGFWSVKVTSERFGQHPAVAIELDPDTFAGLQVNAGENGNRFDCLNRAVFDKDGEHLDIFGDKHEARTVAASDAGTARHGSVLSSTLDRIVADAGFQTHGKVVLKLDVEGVEIKALQGAAQLLEKDVLLIYEDHGSDRDHEISRYLTANEAMRVFGYLKGSFFEIEDLADLTSLKTNRRKGYDFFATRSQFWLDQLAGLIAGQSVSGPNSAELRRKRG
ncbi:FkbM family methyltransferase [Roseibium sp.]|uniref:FkbM family methyltransferase n=1 Tax=Roseibium sp. TaxID=1936156 RepID=UPI003B528ABD